MTAEQRKNIGRGVKQAAMRKRQSEAMKASWVRRRAQNGGVSPFIKVEPQTGEPNLRAVAELLGIDTERLIRDAIMSRIA